MPTSDSVTITVNPLFSGVKNLTWRTTDGQLFSPYAIYTINYINSPPTCTDTSFTTDKNTVGSWSSLPSLCADNNNDPINLSITGSTPPFGTVRFNSDYVLQFDSTNQKRSGSFNLKYIASDTIDQATCNINITVNNRPPVAQTITVTYQQSYSDNTPYKIEDYIKMSASSDPDKADSVRVSKVELSTCKGTVTNNANEITYVPESSLFNGKCDLSVTITDDDSDNPLTSTAIIHVIMNPRSPPIAVDDKYTADQGSGSITIPTSGLLSNDISPLGATIEFHSIVACDDDLKKRGYCHRIPIYNAITDSITIPVDPMNCIADKFQYTIQTTDESHVKSSANVTIEFTNCYCRSALDLYLILDNSASIGVANFKLLREFSINVTNQLDISPTNVNIGIVDFGYEGNLLLSLNNDRNKIKKTLLNMEYRGENTNTKGGIYAAVGDITGRLPNNGTKMNNGVGRGRADVPKVLLVITDGMPNVPCKCEYSHQDQGCNILYGFRSNTPGTPVNCTQGNIPTNVTQCSDCSRATNCMPCADPSAYTDQINSWKTAQTSAYSKYPLWKVIPFGIGSVLVDETGQNMLRQMSYDKKRTPINVSWQNLEAAVNLLTDAACNT
ncbi:hypothetical protein AKO1_005751 [Acrasis kona]|uniref:VWFA domain-containing protein n=1 Tax=Acrasis kona TaxID=1008807 RepID=A0AAW2YJD1_9EUKA